MITALALIVAMPAFSQTDRRAVNQDFASDFSTIPVAANVPGLNGTFQTYMAIYNPTASAFSVTASLYDASGTKRDATITLNAGETKTYQNFLSDVFSGFTGGGALTLSSPQSVGGTHNNRFIVTSEVRTSATHFSTAVPVLEFAGSSSRSFAPGIIVDSNSRTNVGCFNQGDSTNTVTATVLDSTGHAIGSQATLTLPPHAWGQTSVTTAVSGGAVQFDPTDNAVCYAVVVDNSTGDGRFISATEYTP
jgi:hypothetical protein